jgi:Domain of unknown function DUF11
MQFRRSIHLVFAAVVITFITACGGGSDSGSTTNSQASIPTPASPGGVVSVPDIKVTSTSLESPVASGENSFIEFAVSNSGSEAATGLSITTLLGTGLTQIGVTCTSTGTATCPSTSGNSIDIPSLPASSSLVFRVSFSVILGASGPIISTATLVAGNLTTSTPLTTSFSVNTYSADVRVTGKSAATRVVEGGVNYYTMTVTNAGPDIAQNLTLLNALDNSQVLGAIKCSATGGAICPDSLGPTMVVLTLPKNGSLEFTMPGLAPRTGTPRILGNRMTVRSAGDPITLDNTSTASVEAVLPNSIRLTSDPNDYIGGGRSYQYSQENSLINVSANARTISVNVSGDQNWFATFQLPANFSQLQVGKYPNLTRYPFQNAGMGGISWSGEGRGCNTLTGSMTVTKAEYKDNVLEAIDFSFEQYCEGGPGALRGEINWTNVDTSRPPGPINPAPNDLWSPAPGLTPLIGSYVYLESEASDYIGGGRTYSYTRSNAILDFRATGRDLQVFVTGDQSWTGHFRSMVGLEQLQPGFYGYFQSNSRANTTQGGLSWSGQNSSCGASGWFVIDSISYTNGQLTAIDMRFEQRCDGNSAALRGKIRLVANDPNKPPGPIVPPPPGLWTPPVGQTPISGNYVYMTGDAGDYISQGLTYLYTAMNSSLSVSSFGNAFGINISGNESWSAGFTGMAGLTRLLPGFYPDLRGGGVQNPIKGSLSVNGQGRGCNTSLGWFVIDSISYDAAGLAAISLRFQQNCEGGAAALRGKIVWARDG